MNEITLSNNIQQIELEIDHHKKIAGQSVWEIGRRLNHVKENNMAHGSFMDWVSSQGIEQTAANRMMKVASELPNSATLHNLGATALYLIASLPEEERDKEHVTSSGEIKTVDEMTVRELKHLRKEIDKKDAEIESLKKRGLEVIEKEVVKEVKVTPPDYDGLKSDNQQLSKALKEQQEENQKMRNQINQWQAEQGELDKKSKRYDELSQAIQDMEGRMDTQQKRIAAVKDITSKLKAGNQLIDELSGLIYLADYEELSRNDFLSAEMAKLLRRLTNFTHDLSNRLDHTTILEGEIIND